MIVIRVLTIVSILIASSFNCYAGIYEILYVNSDSIHIGNTIAREGLFFDGSKSIQWSSEKQAMEVRDVQTKKVYTIYSQDYKAKQSKSVQNYIFGNGHLSTYGPVYNSSSAFLLNCLYIDVPIYWIGQDYSYVVFWLQDDKIKYAHIKQTKDGKYLIVPREIFNLPNDQIVVIDIIGCDNSSIIPIITDLSIKLLPLK